MNILIVGCGKVGPELAATLSREGHSVTIVDANEAAFEKLPPDYSGYCTAGIPIDRDVLREAGIENCDALAAVSPDDNTNIMVCQVAKEYFDVENIVARIYDPRRENVFAHFGLRTICPTNLTVETVKNLLMEEPDRQVLIGQSTVSFHTVPVSRKMVGMLVSELNLGEGKSPFAVCHEDGSMTMAAYQPITIRAGDSLVVAAIVD